MMKLTFAVKSRCLLNDSAHSDYQIYPPVQSPKHSKWLTLWRQSRKRNGSQEQAVTVPKTPRLHRFFRMLMFFAEICGNPWKVTTNLTNKWALEKSKTHDYSSLKRPTGLHPVLRCVEWPLVFKTNHWHVQLALFWSAHSIYDDDKTYFGF